MFREAWNAQKSPEVFGKCNTMSYHGHNYPLLVTVRSAVTPSIPFLIDLRILKIISNDEVLKKLAHKNVNFDAGFLLTKMSSTN